MKVLNLYAGIGGNRKLWQDVEVTAVELEVDISDVYHKLYPDDLIINEDAHQYLIEHYKEFDFIWSSPPCPTHSRMQKATRHPNKKYPDMKLYQEIIFLQHFFKGKWVVENVKPYYEPLIKPNAILERHFFWSNFSITHFEMEQKKSFITTATLAGRQEIMDWLDIHFEEIIYYKKNHCPVQVLRNCVHPKIGQHILNCARNIIKSKDVSQILLQF